MGTCGQEDGNNGHRGLKKGKGVRGKVLKNYLLCTMFNIWVMVSLDTQTPALCNILGFKKKKEGHVPHESKSIYILKYILFLC